MDLSFLDLRVFFGDREALRGITASLRPGRVTAILGPNGSGKSSLLRALAGLVPADVRLANQRVDRMDPQDRARGIGYLPQEAAVHWDLRVEALVELGRMPHRGRFAGLSDMDRAAIARAVAATDCQDLLHRNIYELSGGERARVLLARVLAGEPNWLLADEPLASLDPAHQLALMAKFHQLASDGMGVAIVLHDLTHAARVADDVLLLKDGVIVAAGPTAEALTADTIREAFGVEVTLVRDEVGRSLPLLIGPTP